MELNQQKEMAYNMITEVLLHIGDGIDGLDDLKKTNHMFDVMEVVLAEAIAEASVDHETLDALIKSCFSNVNKIAINIQDERRKGPSKESGAAQVKKPDSRGAQPQPHREGSQRERRAA